MNTKPKFSLDQPNPEVQNDIPQDRQDMWKNIIDRYGEDFKTIKELLSERRQYGIDLYGTPLQVSNKRNAIADLISEHLDAVAYSEIVRIENPGLENYIVTHQKYLLFTIELFVEIMNEKNTDSQIDLESVIGKIRIRKNQNLK